MLICSLLTLFDSLNDVKTYCEPLSSMVQNIPGFPTAVSSAGIVFTLFALKFAGAFVYKVSAFSQEQKSANAQTNEKRLSTLISKP